MQGNKAKTSKVVCNKIFKSNNSNYSNKICTIRISIITTNNKMFNKTFNKVLSKMFSQMLSQIIATFKMKRTRMDLSFKTKFTRICKNSLNSWRR